MGQIKVTTCEIEGLKVIEREDAEMQAIRDIIKKEL